MEERLQKVMAHSGIASRRQCEELIRTGQVRVNGKKVTELGTKVDPSTDRIEVQGAVLRGKEPLIYLVLNKPAGYITSVKDEKGRRTVMELLPRVKVRVYPVGRLDYDSEGLVLLTNDGRLAHELMHPRYSIPKTYLVEVKGQITDEALQMLRVGVALDDGMTKKAKVNLVTRSAQRSMMRITIFEGRNRQVRRMYEHVGFSVVKLARISLGPLHLGSLSVGKSRRLTEEEIGKLKRTVRSHG